MLVYCSCEFVHDEVIFCIKFSLARVCSFLHTSSYWSVIRKTHGQSERTKWSSTMWTVPMNTDSTDKKNWQISDSNGRRLIGLRTEDQTRCLSRDRGWKTLDISDQVRLARLESSYKSGFLRQSRAERSERARGMWGLWYRRYLYTIVFGRCHLNAS